MIRTRLIWLRVFSSLNVVHIELLGLTQQLIRIASTW